MENQKMEYVRDHSKILNYQPPDYNNYQSWSNKFSGKLFISSIDEYNTIQTNKFNDDKIEKIEGPVQTFGDTDLTWTKTQDVKNFYDEIEANEKNDLYKQFKNTDKQHNDYSSLYPYEFLKK